MYAVNAHDLLKFTNNPVHPVSMLLVPMLTQTVINCEPDQFDGEAVLVSKRAVERWDAIVYLIRKGSGCYPGIHRSHLRIYRKMGNYWKLM
jgi:hypothetical protein